MESSRRWKFPYILATMLCTAYSPETFAAENSLVLIHHTSPYSLPLIFEHGLYLSAKRFTVFHAIPTRDANWTRNLVALAFTVPSNEIDAGDEGLQLGHPQRLTFPPELRQHLLALDAQYDERDKSIYTSQKAPALRAAVTGAHHLLIEEQNQTLRHFGVETFDIKTMREANRFGRYRAVIGSYLDALTANHGQPLRKPVRTPLRRRIADAITYKFNFQR